MPRFKQDLWSKESENFAVKRCFRNMSVWWICIKCWKRRRRKNHLMCLECSLLVSKMLRHLLFEG